MMWILLPFLLLFLPASAIAQCGAYGLEACAQDDTYYGTDPYGYGSSRSYYQEEPAFPSAPLPSPGIRQQFGETGLSDQDNGTTGLHLRFGDWEDSYYSDGTTCSTMNVGGMGFTDCD